MILTQENTANMHSRARAYVEARSLTEGSNLRSYEYIAWITGKIREWEQAHNVREHTPLDSASFDVWLRKNIR
ncbi:hypothetical protein J2T13_000166 [Paenibacillus sp. DS2015]